MTHENEILLAKEILKSGGKSVLKTGTAKDSFVCLNCYKYHQDIWKIGIGNCESAWICKKCYEKYFPTNNLFYTETKK